jgi:hypothetical protein
MGPTPARNNPQIKPFGVSTDLEGNVWITDNRSNTMSILSPEGKPLKTLPGTFAGKTVLSHPLGDAADIQGNIWVANTDYVDVRCPTRTELGPASNPSITMFQADKQEPYPGSPFTGGGLTLPWGVAVDGDDTAWVFNFGTYVVNGTPSNIPTGISRFCGVDTKKCPPGMHIGEPISPDTGYRSDAFDRLTGGAIDPSGNIWIANNWKIDVNPFVNPGENSIVIAIGAAGPLKTPLIGPPVPFKK